MKINVHTEPFHYITVENLWTEKEHKEMFEEILLFESKGLFGAPEKSQSAKDTKGNVLKRNRAEFFDSIWGNTDYSHVLTHNQKIANVFEDDEVKKSWYFKDLGVNHYTTLVSYYENSDYYKSHRDDAIVTVLNYFFKEPKRFEGGEIIFTDYDLKFQVTNEITIIFPSNIKHEVSEIYLDKKYEGKGLGRFCMNQFLTATRGNQ
jgi:Rps23 Pro-64 3,4-dihydroxylase Tpa1-like proline 4-hydroxylase